MQDKTMTDDYTPQELAAWDEYKRGIEWLVTDDDKRIFGAALRVCIKSQIETSPQNNPCTS